MFNKVVNIIVLLFLLFVVACNSNNNTTNSNILKPAKNQKKFFITTDSKTFTCGDTIKLQLSTNDSITADTVAIFWGRKQLNTFTNVPPEITITTNELPVGQHALKTLVKYNGKSESHSVNIVLLSDIVPPTSTFKVVNTYPHDKEAYTQGLFYYNGFLYESTGMNNRSSLRKVNLEDGEVLQSSMLPGEFFGEGATRYKDKIIQLTWKSQLGFIYDLETLKQERQFSYHLEGWGIETIGDTLYISDGSSLLHLWNAQSLSEIGKIQVYDNNGPVPRLNELEYINGLLYANIYNSDEIVVIHPKNGKVQRWIDLSGLMPGVMRTADMDVLNGIAYDNKKNRLFVTGKNWPKLFEIKIID